MTTNPLHRATRPWRAIAPPTAIAAAVNDNGVAGPGLDRYYTREDIAARLYAVFCWYFDPARYRIVEPSAGTGSFFRILPPGSIGFDVDPRYPGIATADFLTINLAGHLASNRPIAIIGNPPFGRNASMAMRFFNHAAQGADVIALVLPRSFRKASIENRLDPAFHRIHEEVVPDDAFLVEGRPYSVPALFQIWVRLPVPRRTRVVETTHPDFAFTRPHLADFAIQRVGARAGRVHRDFTASPSSHYFIRGDGRVEAIMRRLDLARIAADVAGNPSLAKSEIVAAYRAWREIAATASGRE